MKSEISILLPYKEKYTLKESSAASIWVKDYLKLSKLKDKTLVFGNLSKKDTPLTKNFINLEMSKVKYRKSNTVYGNTDLKDIYKLSYKNIFLKKNLIESGSKLYVNKFLKFLLNRDL